MKEQTILLASAGTRENLCGLIDQYFYADKGNWGISDTMHPQHIKTGKIVEEIRVTQKKNRWRLESILPNN